MELTSHEQKILGIVNNHPEILDNPEKRTQIAEEEIREHVKFDHTIVNHEDKLEKTISNLAEIINT